MSRLAGTFDSLAALRTGAYVPYICAGDPSHEFTIELVRRLCKAGADVLELGLPFSDPLADGPVIQEAMRRSLAAGFKVEDVFKMVSSIRREGLNQPIVLMTYYNPVLQFGVKQFCERLAGEGGDGVLVVDLPIEESGELEEHASACKLDVIRLVTPTTTDDRLDELLAKASGFVYIVSVAGVTGARDGFASSTTELMKRVRSKTNLPAVIGFGISHPEHVRMALSAGSSGVVEGSALIAQYAPILHDRERALLTVEQHAKDMKSATNRNE
jgi:tryptophan synthase alpha chain